MAVQQAQGSPVASMLGRSPRGGAPSGRVPAPPDQRWDTVYGVSVLETLGIFIGIPAAMFALLAARTLSQKGPRAAIYQMSDRWTHPPILWSATDEAIGGHGHGHSEFSVGGGTSGNW